MSVCGRLMVGSGTDTYDPVCELREGHGGSCKSTAAVDQHKIVAQFMEGDPLDNAERLLAGALEGHLPADEAWWHFTRGEVADLEVALAELRRAREERRERKTI